MTDAVCECTYFDEGDWVESRLNPNIRGIVVSNADFGRYVNVQLVGSLEIRPFFAVTLRHAPEGRTPPGTAEPLPDNVVRVDFTKPRDLRKDTNTEGAA